MSTFAIPIQACAELNTVRRRIKAILIGSAGNLVEWYDFLTFMQALVIISIAAGFVLRLVDAREFLSLLGIQVFVLGILSTVSLWLNESTSHYYKPSALAGLEAIAPMDLLLYRPVLMYASAKGVFQFPARQNLAPLRTQRRPPRSTPTISVIRG